MTQWFFSSSRLSEKDLENYAAKLYSDESLDGVVDPFETSDDSRNDDCDLETEDKK